MKTRKLASLAMTPLVLTGVAVAVPIAGATAASAAPSQCQVGRPIGDDNSGFVVCHAGSGQVRVKLTCEDGVTGKNVTSYGPWVGVGKKSQTSCGAPQRYILKLVDYQTR
ncbi:MULTISPECIES: hypothetical protein [Streptomyces]|uniref:hypothetical protein n=1 Tax=Streptomyces TaxID=1883 RepID=UPI00201CD9F1|nr:hypothetical protein [Streptomyces panaciradicis]MCL6667808.1 hypothetical protein [Streptomyces panaciradicis]